MFPGWDVVMIPERYGGMIPRNDRGCFSGEMRGWFIYGRKRKRYFQGQEL